MASNLPKSRDELRALADEVLRAKLPRNVAIEKLEKKAKRRQRRKIGQIINRERQIASGAGSRRARRKHKTEVATYGKLGPASNVRKIDPATGEAK